MKMTYVTITAIDDDKKETKKRIYEIIAPAYKKVWHKIKGLNKFRTFEEYVNTFKSDPRVKDIEKRARWDIYYLIPSEVLNSDEVWELTRGLKNTELDTVLKKIVRTLD